MVSTERTLGNRYRLLDRIAAGAMGVVYEAEDLRLERNVALKVLNEGLAAEEKFVERFRREARSAAALSHPNVASVFDYGEDDGLYYIVMERVEGQDLARLLRTEAPLSIERAVRIAGQAATALGHAHSADLVHRDVKPANVLISANDHVKVTDFGIARAGGQATLTATGSVLGTAHYISPEQAAGGEVTPRSDVYSFGVVLYEMLTGSVPFTGDNIVAVASRHAKEDVPAPSSVRPDVPAWLDDVVGKATSRNPSARYPDGSALAAALSTGSASVGETAVLSQAPVPAPADAAATLVTPGASRTTEMPATPLPPITGQWDPQKLGRRIVAIAFVLLLLAVGGGLWRLMSADDDTPRERGGGTATTVDDVFGGEAPAALEVPTGLVGMTYDEASDALAQKGLEAKREEVTVKDGEPDIVTDVSPEEGSDVKRGDTITLFVTDPEKTKPPEDDGPGKGKGHAKGKGKKD